jgi:hypothetical protein
LGGRRPRSCRRQPDFDEALAGCHDSSRAGHSSQRQERPHGEARRGGRCADGEEGTQSDKGDLADGGGPGAHVAYDVEDAAAFVELLGKARGAAARLEVLTPASEEDGGEDAQVGLHALELLLEVQHDLRGGARIRFGLSDADGWL